MLFVPFLAAFFQAASSIISKIGLTRRRIAFHDFVTGLFLYLAALTWLLTPIYGSVDYNQLAEAGPFALVAGLILVATAWNVLYYRSIQSEKVNIVETVLNFVPISTIALGWVVYPGKFIPMVGLAGVVATGALLWGFWDKHRLNLSLSMVGLVILMAIEHILAVEVLTRNIMSPVTLYAVRTTVIFLIFLTYYRPSLHLLKVSTHAFLALTAVIGGSNMVFKYYGLRDSGVFVTSLVLILVPVLVFTGSVALLREHLRPRRLIAVAIMLAAVLVAGR